MRERHLLPTALGAALAIVSLLGWLTGTPILTTFLPERPAMAPMTAITVLVGASAVLALPTRSRVSLVLGCVEASAGIGILLAQALDVPYRQWIPQAWWTSSWSGVMLTASGGALALLSMRWFAAGQILSLGVLLLASLMGLGHVFPDADLYGFVPGTGVAIPSVTAYLALSTAQLLVERDQGVVGALTHRSLGGRAGLRLLMGGLSAVLLLAVCVIEARRHDAFDPDTAVLLTAWGAIALFGGALWGLAVAVARAERARIVAELDRDRTQQMVTAAVAHDLRNPLSTAVMAARLLGRYVDEPHAVKALERIERSHRRLDRLLRSLLDGLTVSAGRPLALQASPCALHELAAEVVGENDGVLAQRTVVAGQADGWWDRDALVRVIENLLLNAVKYGEPGTPIRCDIAIHNPSKATLSVTNQGPAIDESEWERIFEPFMRGQSGVAATHVGHAGWGVGLAYARAVAVGHGGAIRVVASGPAGTVVRLELPMDARGLL